MDLNKLTDKEGELLVGFTKAVIDEVNRQRDDPVAFLEMTDSESERQITEQSRLLAERRREGRSGRFIADATSEDRQIRAGIKDWMRRTGRLRKYGVIEEND
jgi:hypothetical protein